MMPIDLPDENMEVPAENMEVECFFPSPGARNFKS